MENNQRSLQGAGTPAAPEVPTVDSYLERAAMFLEDRDWSKADEYCEKVLDINPKNAQAYLYKLLVQLRVTQPDRLIDQTEPFYHLDACQKAVRFGDAALQATLANYNAQVTARKEESLYQTGCSLMAQGTVEGYRQAAETFSRIPNRDGVPHRIAECRQAADKLQQEAALAKKRKRKKLSILISSICVLIALTAALIMALPYIRYNRAISLMEEGRYENALSIFQSLTGFKDSTRKTGQCQQGIEYNAAIALMEAGNHREALAAFDALDGYQDSAELAKPLRLKLAQWETVSAGGYHTVGLKADGTVVAVGDNYDGQCDVDVWTDIIAVSAGGNHTVGLKADGTVVAVGKSDYGQCAVAGWTDIIAVCARYHTVGLKADGTVVAVGENYWGQCDVKHWTGIKLPE